MCKITIIDSIMGSGKTTWSIDKMNNDIKNNYIYITPYLTEIQRIKQQVTNKKFYEPINLGNGKQDNLHNLILQEKNIASTHALFKTSDETTKSLLEASNYILILDEVMDVIEEVKLKKDDIKLLLDNNIISIDKDNNNLVRWNKDKLELDTQYNYLKKMCLNENVFMVDEVMLMWTFPVNIFNSFKEVYVLTYQFKGQIQKYYYDLYNIDYEYKSINQVNGKYEICNYIEKYDMEDIRNKIKILEDDKLNSIGKNEYALSKSWFDSNKILVSKLKNNVDNYFKNKLKSKSKDNMWTTFKEYKSKITGKGYTKGFVSLNCRATNDYCNKINLAYCSNRFLNPIIKRFFIDRGVNVNEEIFALSELIQWIWRSRIRKGEEINLYIPSSRMRRLLKNWLEGEDIG